MKKIFLILIIIALTFSACGGNQSESFDSISEGEESSNILRVSYEIDKYIETDSNGYEIPFSELYIIFDDGRDKVKIGKYLGYLEFVEKVDREVSDIPTEALIAFRNFYAGAGDVLFLEYEANKLNVKWKPIYENIEDYGAEVEFEIIESFDVEGYSSLEIIK